MADSTFTIQIQGIDKLQSLFKKAPDILTPILQKAISDSKVVVDNNRINPSYIPYISGNLARRWTTNYEDNNLTLITSPDVDYARAVEYGMDPEAGRFVPGLGQDKKGRRLINTVDKNGRERDLGIWPGFAGRFYIEKILAVSEIEINVIFDQALQDAVAALSI